MIPSSTFTSTSSPGQEALFTCLAELGEYSRLEPMLDRVCAQIIAMGIFRSCVLGFYTSDEAGYGVGGDLPPETRSRFYESYYRSSAEQRAARRVAFLSHRRPGTHIVFLPSGTGPASSSAAVPTPLREGSWNPEDRLFVLCPIRRPDAVDGEFFLMLCLDDPIDGERPTESVLRRLEPVEEFLKVVGVHIENRLLADRLRASESRYREIFAALPAAVAVVGEDGRVVYSNRDEEGSASGVFLGLPGTDCRALGWTSSARAALDRLVRDGVPLAPMETSLRDGTRSRRLLLTGAPLSAEGERLGPRPRRRRAVLVAEEVTELRALESRRLDAQKMEAIGRLAGGVAHEFNNLLTTVVGNLELSRQYVDGCSVPRVVELLADAQIAAERGGILTRQLLAYAHPVQLGFRALDPAVLCRECADLLRRTTDRRIDVRLDAPGGLPPISGDFALLQQSVLNLCLNACDALVARLADRRENDASWAPTLTLRVRRELVTIPGVAGPCVRITVADNGRGMDDRTLDRAFEPFFSLAPETNRSGLGLALTHGVIRQHGGDVRAESSPQSGTVFTVWLPISTSVEDGHETVADTKIQDAQVTSRVLVVDDEKLVRRTYECVLQEFGFDVETVAGGEQAVAELKVAPGAFDVVVLDYTMPGLSGRETLERLRAEGVTVPPVLLVTGDPSQAGGDDLVELGVVEVLLKPVGNRDLVAALRRAIASPAASVRVPSDPAVLPGWVAGPSRG